MSYALKLAGLALLLLLIAAAIAVNVLPVRQINLHYTEHTSNAGELVGGNLVGQTFVARTNNLSGVAVKFATYSNRNNTKPVEFYLREGLTGPDVRAASVNAAALGDNQLHRFEFAPIPDSYGRTFFFYVVSAESQPGDAVTVDLDTRDPYHEGSAYLVRGETSPTTPAVLDRSGRQTVDVVFATYYSTSLRTATINSTRNFVRSIIATWDQRQGQYLLWLELFAPVLALCLLIVGLPAEGPVERLMSPKLVRRLLAGVVVGGVLLRVLYAVAMPITNDEGNYLYDAQALIAGTLAGGDGYVKAPLVIAWLAAWEFIFGHTVLAGRLAMLVVSAVTSIPIYFLTKAAFGQRAGLLSAAAWALLGTTAVFGVYVHTQAVALAFGVTGLACLWVGLKRGDPFSKWFIMSGVLLGLGVASRKSILALGLVPLILIFLLSRTWHERLRHLLQVGCAFGLVIGAFVVFAVALYGCDKPLFILQDGQRCMGVEEALGINSAEDGLTSVTPEEEENVRAYSLRGMTPFFREGLPLIFLSLVGWGIVLERASRQFFSVWRRGAHLRWAAALRDQLLPRLVWLAPAGVLWWAWSFFSEYEGAVFQELGGMQWLWWAFMAMLIMFALWTRPATPESEQPVAPGALVSRRQPWSNLITATGLLESAPKLSPELIVETRTPLVASLVPLAWAGGLIIFYMNWIKFHANYIVEFLPPLVIMAGIGAVAGWQRLREVPRNHQPWQRVFSRILAGVFLLVIIWAAYLSNYVTYMFEHTGTFDQGAVKEAAAWAVEHIPLDQPLFTGAAVVPYVSGHRVALDIAHPRWYAYEFTRKDTERLATFLPATEAMLQAFREAQWFLLDQQTSFSFLMEYSEIERGLTTDWQVVHRVENLSNELIFYQRVR